MHTHAQSHSNMIHTHTRTLSPQWLKWRAFETNTNPVLLPASCTRNAQTYRLSCEYAKTGRSSCCEFHPRTSRLTTTCAPGGFAIELSPTQAMTPPSPHRYHPHYNHHTHHHSQPSRLPRPSHPHSPTCTTPEAVCSEFIEKSSVRVGRPLKWSGGYINTWVHMICARIKEEDGEVRTFKSYRHCKRSFGLPTGGSVGGTRSRPNSHAYTLQRYMYLRWMSTWRCTG
jgi:hypothetical protein